MPVAMYISATCTFFRQVTPWSGRPSNAPGSARGPRPSHRPSSSRDSGSRPPLQPIRVSGCGFNNGHAPSAVERLGAAYGGAVTARPATGIASRRTPVNGRPETARSSGPGGVQHTGYNGSAHMSHTSTKRPSDLMTEALRVLDHNQATAHAMRRQPASSSPPAPNTVSSASPAP